MESSPGPSTSSCSRPEDPRVQSSATGTPRAGTCPHLSFTDIFSLSFLISNLKNKIKCSLFPGMQCIPQRAALLKSMLNFLKKAIQDPAFSDGIRHGELLSSSNFEFYQRDFHKLRTQTQFSVAFFFLPVMDGSLPTSLKHIISNAEYYGPSLFLLGKFVAAH